MSTNTEVRDEFNAKGLKEARQVLDLMRLQASDQHGYDRYLDSLHLKASELYSLQVDAEWNVGVKIAKNLITIGLDDSQIAAATNLSTHHIAELCAEINTSPK